MLFKWLTRFEVLKALVLDPPREIFCYQKEGPDRRRLPIDIELPAILLTLYCLYMILYIIIPFTHGTFIIC